MEIPEQILEYLFSTTPAWEVVPFHYYPITRYIHIPENKYLFESLAVEMMDGTMKIFLFSTINSQWKIDDYILTNTSFTFERFIEKSQQLKKNLCSLKKISTIKICKQKNSSC
jgi:hypothetical protein